MKKVLLLTGLLNFVSLCPALSAEEYMPIGGIGVEVGYDMPQGYKWYYVTNNTENSGITTYTWRKQNEEKLNINFLSIRVNKMAKIFTEKTMKLSAGIELGVSLPMSKISKTWYVPCSSPTLVGIAIEPEKFFYAASLSDYYKYEYTFASEIIIIPILGRVSYTLSKDTQKEINLSVSGGEYVYFLNMEENTTLTYLYNYYNYKPGDVTKDIYKYRNVINILGFEVNVYYKILNFKDIPNLSVSIGGKYIWQPETKGAGFIFKEYSDYYKTDKIQTTPTITTMRNGFLFGGTIYSILGSLNYSF